MKTFSIYDFRLAIGKIFDRRMWARRGVFHPSSFILRPFKAFTILELLVSMAVLAMILVMLLQVVNGILQSTKTQSQQMDSAGAARRMLDVMQADLSKAIVGENAAIFVNSSSPGLAFLTARRGPTGSVGHRFLAVQYGLGGTNNTQLTRSYGSSSFANTNLLLDTVNTPTNSVLADGILGFQIRVLTSSSNYASTGTPSANWATNNYNNVPGPGGWNALLTGSPSFAAGLPNRARALQIWVAAVDKQSLQLVSATSAQAVFGTDPTAWQSSVDTSTNLPAPVKSCIRILTKTFALP
ncbi:MAG: prepilin-type N-terminal cleavage/methylation domain-containing protein [Verrucomicrobia bacterium]|nr:prepilin-type N-terminal cleavage/methylation domain-containing protein [Verrucomicrobiota bacterium]